MNPFIAVGTTEVFGNLNVTRVAPGDALEIRQLGDRKNPVGSPELVTWLDESGARLGATTWTLRFRGNKKRVRSLRQLIAERQKAKQPPIRAAASLLAALSGLPPGDHHGRDVDPAMQKLVAGIRKAAKKGEAVWNRPWIDGTPHQNGASGRRYRGINRLWLTYYCYLRGWRSPFWYTLNQIRKRGGKVKHGCRPVEVVFVRSRPLFAPWDHPDVPQPNLDGKLKPGEGHDWESIYRAGIENRFFRTVDWLRSFEVYNWEQVGGIEEPPRARAGAADEPPIRAAERIAAGYLELEQSPRLDHIGDHAYYHLERDEVVVPPVEQFRSREAYYATLFHELAHSTGHRDRLNRPGFSARRIHHDSPIYSHEELVAEMTAAELMSEAGLSSPTSDAQNHAYLAGWASTLDADPNMLISAAFASQKALDLILGQDQAKPPSARTLALEWLHNDCETVTKVEPFGKGKQLLRISVTGRATPYTTRTRLTDPDKDGHYRFPLTATDIKAFHASRKKRVNSDLDAYLLIPLIDGEFDPDAAKPILVPLDRLVRAGLTFNTFKGLGGKTKTVTLELHPRQDRKVWYVSIPTAGVKPIRLYGNGLQKPVRK